MNSPSIQSVRDEITAITSFLVEAGFADDQNYPIWRGGRSDAEISFPNANMALMLRDISYVDLYASQRDAGSYNVLMLDGALIQISYEFANSTIVRCRLAFLPSPTLEAFQNEPELYEDDVLYADIISRQVVTVPIRFEFDDRGDVAKNVDHPSSHVTLGQYSNCRIAATAPLTPGVFMGFILRSFYNTAARAIAHTAPCRTHRWEPTITPEEAALLHVAVP